MIGSARRMLFRALEGLQNAHLELATPDGETQVFGDSRAELRAAVFVHHERFFGRVLWGGDEGAGDAYVDGDWSSPDLVAVVRLAVRNRQMLMQSGGALAWASRAVNRIRHLRNRNTLQGSRRNIAAHYDLSNDFFRLFLDRNMVYSSAVYPTPEASLEDAQIEKLDRICRKLRLTPGDRLLEIGTGWGAFALHAAQQYGCRVTTTTISRQQYDHAAKQFSRHGVQDRVRLLHEDYRNLRGEFDKIASIEMFEAVGLDHYDEFFAACDRLLAPNGLMAMQTITMNEHHFSEYRKGSDWIQRRIFPGAQLASVREIQNSLVRCTTMNLLDLEDIGLHYAHTLAEWRRRFQASDADIRSLGFEEPFLRAWDYYLAYSEGAFRERNISDVHIVLAKAGNPSALDSEPWKVLPARAELAGV
jgi:cyclopropane-fatty-acyl-phospholipid synthase